MRLTIILAVACLALVACAPKAEPPFSEPLAGQPAPSTDVPQQPVPPPEPSGVSSSIGGAPSGPGIQPSGKTKNLIMTVTKDGYNPRIVTVIPGDRLKITLTNEDLKEHSFILPKFNIDKRIPGGETVVIDFTPLEQGEWLWTERDGSKAGTLIVEYG